MNWTTSTVTPNTALTDATTSQALKSALASVASPTNVATANPTQATAQSDNRTALVRVGQLETLAVTPWSDGIFSGTKRSQSFYLSASDAQAKMNKLLANTGWQSAFLIMAMADSETQLLEALQQINTALPMPEAAAAIRRAQALADHEKTKRFSPGEQVKNSDKKAAATIANDQTIAAQNIAVTDAIATDQEPTAILANFIQRRTARLQEIAEALNATGGEITYTMKISGNIKTAFDGITPPNEQAPLACVFAIGGTTDQMAALYEVTGL